MGRAATNKGTNMHSKLANPMRFVGDVLTDGVSGLDGEQHG
jgi:hypothetical protein